MLPRASASNFHWADFGISATTLSFCSQLRVLQVLPPRCLLMEPSQGAGSLTMYIFFKEGDQSTWSGLEVVVVISKGTTSCLQLASSSHVLGTAGLSLIVYSCSYRQECPPRVPPLSEAGSTSCQYFTEGGWLGTQEACRIFTKRLVKIGWCWKDVACGFHGKAQAPRILSPYLPPPYLKSFPPCANPAYQGPPTWHLLLPPPDAALLRTPSSSVQTQWHFSILDA